MQQLRVTKPTIDTHAPKEFVHLREKLRKQKVRLTGCPSLPSPFPTPPVHQPHPKPPTHTHTHRWECHPILYIASPISIRAGRRGSPVDHRQTQSWAPHQNASHHDHHGKGGAQKHRLEAKEEVITRDQVRRVYAHGTSCSKHQTLQLSLKTHAHRPPTHARLHTFIRTNNTIWSHCTMHIFKTRPHPA